MVNQNTHFQLDVNDTVKPSKLATNLSINKCLKQQIIAILNLVRTASLLTIPLLPVLSSSPEIMLISGTHVERVWRESHNDSRRGIAVVCPVWPWALQEPPERCEPTAPSAAASFWALVVRWGRWPGGLPPGGHSTGEWEGTFTS